MLPPEPPKLPTFANQTELHRRIANVFEDLQNSVTKNIGTEDQGVVCVPLIYFNAVLNDSPEDIKEIRFVRRPETLQGLTNVTSKVLMKDPAFLSAITHSFADIMANFFFGVGQALKAATPEAAPETKQDVEEALDEPAPLPDNVLPFRKKTFMPEVNKPSA